MRRSTLARLAVAAVATAMVATALSAPAEAEPPSVTSPAPLPVEPGTRQAQAEQALAKVEALAHPSAKAATGARRDATMALRDLSLLKSALPKSERAKAASYLARPTKGTGGSPYLKYKVKEAKPICGKKVCVHYVKKTADKSSKAYAKQALSVVTKVWKTYAKAGYKTPPGDGKLGGNKKFDVYLGQLADDSLYGYVTTDQKRGKSRWSYGVFDNNYTDAVFNAHTPLQNLQVTAAHEFFHGVQYAYDVYEDAWFMEATATWAEDELYPDVNDNLQYLPYGQLGQPQYPLDAFSGAIHYGNWIFFRYLSEKWPQSKAGLPTIVRSMWQKAGKKQYSIQAVSSVLKSKKSSFAKEFSLFSAKNRFSRTFYAEGAAQAYPEAPFADTISLAASAQTGGTIKLRYHQSSAAWLFQPSGLGAGWKLRVKVDLAAPKQHQAAVVDTITGGTHSLQLIKLNKKGKGSVTVPFVSGQNQVAFTLVNAGTAYKCWKRTIFACQGKSKSDNIKGKITFTTVQ